MSIDHRAHWVFLSVLFDRFASLRLINDRFLKTTYRYFALQLLIVDDEIIADLIRAKEKRNLKRSARERKIAKKNNNFADNYSLCKANQAKISNTDGKRNLFFSFLLFSTSEKNLIVSAWERKWYYFKSLLHILFWSQEESNSVKISFLYF